LEVMGLKGEGRKLDAWWTADDANHADQIVRGARHGQCKLVALGLGASEPSRRWPVQRYLEVIREVAAKRDVAFLAFGGSDVADSCRWLSAQLPGVVSYAGEKLPLGVNWAGIARCDLYLGNDTGLMHMAAAAQIPVVVVIGLAEGAVPGTRGDTTQTGPYDTLSRVVRPPKGTPWDSDLDAALVPADSVAAATLELL
jgi:ADP-heptose:LPS heptosyltransferase